MLLHQILKKNVDSIHEAYIFVNHSDKTIVIKREMSSSNPSVCDYYDPITYGKSPSELLQTLALFVSTIALSTLIILSSGLVSCSLPVALTAVLISTLVSKSVDFIVSKCLPPAPYLIVFNNCLTDYMNSHSSKCKTE
ncbi:hypothetical protein N9N03_00020 [Chlamydiia bacterium]|nr:hypothetical protein [Chlamydiia bacterium]